MKVIGIKHVARKSQDSKSVKESIRITLANPYPSSVGFGVEAFTYIAYGNTECYPVAQQLKLNDDVYPLVSPDGFLRGFAFISDSHSAGSK